MSDTSEQITQVLRARLADMTALADTVAQHLPQWGAVAERCGDETDLDIGAFIAALSPALMLRLVAHANDVLDRHAPVDGFVWCHYDGDVRPCCEVQALVAAWSV